MTYVGPWPDTLFFDDHDIQGYDGIIVTDMRGLLCPGTRKGENVPIPLGPTIGVPKVYAECEHSFPIIVAGATRAQKLSRLAAMSADLVGDGGLGTLKRRLSSDAEDGYDEHTAPGEFVEGLAVELLNFRTGQTELTFLNHRGYFVSAADPDVPIVP